jgi:Na+-transporting NADH:ubiquinone oxidoreductase subunit NqrC
MKTKIVVIIAVIVVLSTIIASTTFVWQVQEQLNELGKQIEIAKSVKITDFSGSWWNPVGVTVLADSNVTITNTGIYDAEGVIVEVRGFDPEFERDSSNFVHTINALRAGETIVFEDTLGYGFNAFAVGSRCLVATLMVGNETVDNRVFYLGQY